MIKLEALERGTPEFQNLSIEEKQRRRLLLSNILGTVIKQGREFRNIGNETGIIVSLALERYLGRDANTKAETHKKLSKDKKKYWFP